MTGTINSYYVQCKAGSEKNIAQKLKKFAQKCCQEIKSVVATPFGGYVRIEVIARQEDVIKCSKLDLPRDARAVIEMTTGVIRICGNGKEAIPE